MKKLINNILDKVLRPVPANDARKELWRFILQTLISILTAILTALGATSCMGLH